MVAHLCSDQGSWISGSYTAWMVASWRGADSKMNKLPPQPANGPARVARRYWWLPLSRPAGGF